MMLYGSGSVLLGTKAVGSELTQGIRIRVSVNKFCAHMALSYIIVSA